MQITVLLSVYLVVCFLPKLARFATYTQVPLIYELKDKEIPTTARGKCWCVSAFATELVSYTPGDTEDDKFNGQRAHTRSIMVIYSITGIYLSRWNICSCSHISLNKILPKMTFLFPYMQFLVTATHTPDWLKIRSVKSWCKKTVWVNLLNIRAANCCWQRWRWRKQRLFHWASNQRDLKKQIIGQLHVPLEALNWSI